MKTVVADIGGTHARFAVLENGVPGVPEKLCVRDYKGFTDMLAVRGHGQGRLLVATAAQPGPDGVWRFHNDNQWTLDAAALTRAGWDLRLLVNDFVASARGAVELKPGADGLSVMRDGPGRSGCPRAILGPGTGLGLAFMTPRKGGRWHVQETFGGHMLAAARTEEQRDILRLVSPAAVPEDVASGRGLPGLYRAVCARAGTTPRFTTAEDILAHPDDRDARAALRLFHEFLGLFAHQAVVTGHAFGGLYLDGGVLHRLRNAGLFDAESFLRFFIPDVAPVVKAALADTPVRFVDDPYVALRGLAAMVKDDESVSDD